MNAMLVTEDGRCPWCGRKARPYDDCCRAKARWRVEVQILAKRLYAPPQMLVMTSP